MNKKIEDIIESVRNLRDDAYCPNAEWQAQGEPDTDESVECTCTRYDEIIDKLEALKK